MGIHKIQSLVDGNEAYMSIDIDKSSNDCVRLYFVPFFYRFKNRYFSWLFSL